MTAEFSLCSQGWQSPQKTAGLKELTASPSKGSCQSDMFTAYLLCAECIPSLANSALRGWFRSFYLYDLQTGNSISNSVHFNSNLFQ